MGPGLDMGTQAFCGELSNILRHVKFQSTCEHSDMAKLLARAA